MKVKKFERKKCPTSESTVGQCQCQTTPQRLRGNKGDHSNTKILFLYQVVRKYYYVRACSKCAYEEKKTKSRRRGPSDCLFTVLVRSQCTCECYFYDN